MNNLEDYEDYEGTWWDYKEDPRTWTDEDDGLVNIIKKEVNENE